MNKAALLIAILSLSGCVLDFDGAGPQGAAPAAGGSGAGLAGGEGPGGAGGAPQGGGPAGGAPAGGAPAQGGDGGEGGGPAIQCEPEQCVAIPDGFAGVVHLQLSPDDSTPALCSEDAIVFEGQEGLTGQPAVCQCACEPSGSCTVPARGWGNDTCTPGLGQEILLGDSGPCTQVPDAINSIKASGALAVSATCTSNGAPALVPPYEFHGYARGCGFESEGCQPNAVCNVPNPNAATCFYRESQNADAVCPENLTRFDVVRTDDSITDERSCICDCSASTAICSIPTVAIFSDSACTQPLGNGAGACVASPQLVAARGTSTLSLTCTENNSYPGNVIADSSMLVCCL